VLPTDRQFVRQTAFFQRMDTDKDGFVSNAEFVAQADRNFARCDLDKDGRINTAECRQALRRPSATPVRSER
jgi:Ca2+-binding EF-hand superfamily protein